MVSGEVTAELPEATATALAERRAREEELQRLTNALLRNPDQLPLLEKRGELHASLGFLRAAERDFERATRLRPREPRLWRALGRVRIEVNLPTSGLQALRRAGDLGLDDQELHLLMARAYRARSECLQALRHYSLALERPPEPTAEMLVEAACLAFDLEEPWASVARGKAELWLDQALAREPECAEAWLAKGFQLELWGGAEDPGAAYRRAVELDPSNLEAWTNLALFLHAQGDRARCEDAVRRALKLEKREDRRRALADLIEEETTARR